MGEGFRDVLHARIVVSVVRTRSENRPTCDSRVTECYSLGAKIEIASVEKK